NASCHRPPILLVHGLLGDSSEFVMNPPASSPGMILADAGFDVFLLNVRGTTYSQRHLNLTKHDGAFWKFSIDDIAYYDAPAAIDKALKLNGASALYWIGHSHGTTISFLMLADRPEYNRKVKAMFEFAPTGTGPWTRGIITVVIWLADKLNLVLDMYNMFLGSHEFGLRIPWFLAGVSRLFCTPLIGHTNSYRRDMVISLESLAIRLIII
ncbi:hypothetical protein PENTCL1PPCAC_14592, partial [Pristionchus entomophagus]